MTYFGESREITEKNKSILVMGLAGVISVIFTASSSLDGVNAVLYETFPDIAGGVMLLFFYMAWRNYLQEEQPFEISILWSVLAVLVSIVDYDAGNTAVRCCIFLTMMIPVSLALCISGGRRRRRVWNMRAWSGCLILFYLFTVVGNAEPFLWSRVYHIYWNRAIYLCCPILLPLMARWLLSHVTGNQSRILWKASGAYTCGAALLIWNDTVFQLYRQPPALRYSPDHFAYFLVLADIIYFREIYHEYKHKVSRGRVMLYVIAVNLGAAAWIMYENIRLFSHNTGLFEWLYGSAAYMDAAEGSNLISVICKTGCLPVLAMTVFLVTALVLLRSRKETGTPGERVRRYLAIGYGVRMALAVGSAAFGIVLSTAFPFAEYSVMDWMLLGIVEYKLHAAQDAAEERKLV